MKTKPAKIRDSYMELILQVPLRPLRTKADYQRASGMIDRLASRDEDSFDAGESDYLDVLSDLVDAYEDKQSKLDRDNTTPAQRLAALMATAGLSVNDIAQILGVSRPLVSMVINGKRALSRMNIQTLANHFRLDPGYFMQFGRAGLVPPAHETAAAVPTNGRYARVERASKLACHGIDTREQDDGVSEGDKDKIDLRRMTAPAKHD